MRVLVACEFSGRVRDAFRRLGHDAVSCDLTFSEAGQPHIRGDVRDHLRGGWDLLIAFPPCTYLCLSGARWWPARQREQAEALDLVRAILAAPVPRVALENPVGRISTAVRQPDQIIHPWQFGHGEKKRTCLWLVNLPPLEPTNVVAGRKPSVHHLAPGPLRSRRRSLTYRGVAAAMAAQWGALAPAREED